MKIIVSLLLLITMNVYAQQYSSDFTDSSIKKMIIPWMKKNNIPGAAVEIYDHGVPHSYYFGYANRQTKRPVTAKTIFEIGSLTKLFTVLLIAEQVQTGNVNLHDSIAKYLPELARCPEDQLRKVTLLNLATHTSGLDFDTSNDIKTRADLIAYYFSNWHPMAPIGSQWRYSNIGIGLLGDALEMMIHQSYNQFYRNKILQPLGMEPIGIIVPKHFLLDYAQGYNKNGNPAPHTQVGLFPGAYALKATGHDMLQFLKAALNLPGTPAAIAHAMQMTQTAYVSTPYMKQGLGWTIYSLNEKNRENLLHPIDNMNPLSATQLNHNEQKFAGDALIDKTGASPGFRAYIAVIPQQKSGIVILANHFVTQSEVILGRKILLKISGSRRKKRANREGVF